MALVQSITSPENRLFASSLGNWTGAATWEPGPFKGFSGMAKIILTGPADPNSFTLAYPHVYAIKKLLCQVLFKEAVFLSPNTLYSKWTLSDGTFSLSDEIIRTYGDGWQNHFNAVTIPDGWTKQTTTLKISIRTVGLYPVAAVYDLMGLYNDITSAQHLPVMGIG